ncbi:hypothetical protein CLV49_1690 [Labedella gwakjiensis]|uniref:YtxH-like protein n=1 Tax=Labedella gwakjiensis TaxID=390269 RepID=A0A2P8GVT7_9MICO|nr:hypothetical protein [Labedella gwakjiensis]PSL38078.1 hypothetical protein CLV49_1690 [Labedella gwakjiensis]RUQ87364.1 hypothetical protein ELQ93_10750 [Labedella gwakjiensis]
MKGKILLVTGLAAGYVLGSRAGRERYEQIKTGWLKLYETEPVQKQVRKAQGFAKARVSAVPSTLFSGAKTIVKIAKSNRSAGQKLDATLSEVDDVKDELGDIADGRSSTTR